MAVGQLAADEKTETRAGLRSEARIVDPEKALEDLVVLVAWNADPVVLDDQRWAVVVDDRQPDPWPSRAVGQRIAHEVVDDSSQLLTVGVDRDRLIWLAVGHLCTEQTGPGLGAGDRLPSHLAQVERLGIRRR